MTSHDDELYQALLKTFALEAAEHVQALNQALLRVERVVDEQKRQELLQEAFRAAHSLKGSARAVNFNEVGELAHRLESVLQQARKGQLNLDPGVCDVLYAALDAIQQLLDGKQISLEALYARLAAISPGKVVAASPETPMVGNAPLLGAVHPEPQTEAVASTNENTIRVAVSKLDNLMAQSGELLIAKISAEQHLTDIQAIRRELSRWSRTWREVKTQLPRANGGKERQLADLLIRHDEQLRGVLRKVDSLQQSVNRDTLRLGMVATRVQDEVRRVRMVPFQTLALTLERVLRDAARAEGKAVAGLVIVGADTELDKKVLETLKDPLIHLLRNAIGHGIELPEARVAAGKAVEGRVTLTVVQRGSEVRISVRDDGRGFDLDALRARSNGAALGDQATADELISLAFQPGVTTASQVTVIAGRGIGLDVVRQCIETLQGRVVVDSVPGQGASIQLLVPVSLAMTRGLLVQVGQERFMLPLMSVEKILKPKAVFTVEGQSLISLDGKAWPLVSLAGVLDLPAGKDTGHSLAVVLRVAEQRVALLVDDMLTEQELAVKPLSKLLKHVPNVAGAALLGNGQPVVVLNAADLIRSAHQERGAVAPASGRTAHGQLSSNSHQAAASILVVDDSITTRTLEKNILQAAGYNVTTATNGEAALHQLRERDFDLVVSDIQMPNMDGFALTRYLRDNADYAALPIILVTSLESAEDRERGLRAGANAYIAKRGFDQAELLSTIRRLI